MFRSANRCLLSVVLVGAICTAGCARTEFTPISARLAAEPGPVSVPGMANFAQVSPVLYRGAQPTREGFFDLKKRGIRTIVNLRYWHDDKALLAGTSLRYIHIPSNPWHIESEDSATFLAIVRDPANQPVFVHCQHGSDRTGAAVACYRVIEQGWTKDEAIAELPAYGFHPIFANVKSYIERLSAESMNAKRAASSPGVRTIE